MNSLVWFDRVFTFGLPKEMLPFYLDRLEGTIARIEQKVKGYSNEILSERFNDKWSVKQHIGHLAEVDQVGNKRLDEIRSGAEIMSRAVFEPQDYNPWPIEKVVDFFRTTRLQNIDKYHSFNESDLSKTSLHPRFKQAMTPVDLAWFDAEHDDHHLVKFTEILKSNVRR